MQDDKNKTQNGAAQTSAGSKKGSTTEIPLVGLDDVVTFVTTIHEAALDMAPMPDVAKGTGYQSATSTPFYRRLVAARLFGFIGANGAVVTKRATDFLKPDQENAKANALQDAIVGVPYYIGLIEKYRGRKLNTDLVKNAISKDFNLIDASASSAARAFAASLKFAGMLSADEIVGTGVTPPKTAEAPDSKPEAGKIVVAQAEESIVADEQKHTLFLDKKKERKITVIAPLDVSRGEYNRICKWLEFALIVEDETKGEGQ